jgi:hypothetical protein
LSGSRASSRSRASSSAGGALLDRDRLLDIEIEPQAIAAALKAVLASGVLDQDTTHGLGRRGKEVTAIFELLIANQAQIRFMHKRRSVERLPRLLAGHLRRGKPAQLVVDQRQELRRGLSVALPDDV